MKRVATVTVKDNDVKVKVEITISANGGVLSREEVNIIIEQLTGRVMEALPNLHYTYFPLFNVKTKI